MNVRCARCGELSKAASRFCGDCGARVSQPGDRAPTVGPLRGPTLDELRAQARVLGGTSIVVVVTDGDRVEVGVAGASPDEAAALLAAAGLYLLQPELKELPRTQ